MWSFTGTTNHFVGIGPGAKRTARSGNDYGANRIICGDFVQCVG
jgi:hypothetical protein